jgi:bisphosphoglycerate-independent phosphoglycerate mutase (AlkP superfamily)
MNRPLVLIILDGWGYAPPSAANAISLARKPNYDRLLREYPNTLIHTSGRYVGLPDGQIFDSTDCQAPGLNAGELETRRRGYYQRQRFG